jgi:hypothetical protein
MDFGEESLLVGAPIANAFSRESPGGVDVVFDTEPETHDLPSNSSKQMYSLEVILALIFVEMFLFLNKFLMVLESIALLSGVKSLFLYNRQTFQFNKTLDQERLYNLQKMRIEQLRLYRDDIRDLFKLVVGKMDNYYLVNTLALGFSLAFYYEGRVPTDVPSWLFWLWAMSLGSAIVCLFLSVWFAVHASVVAQMFSARILTQWLRLPIPGILQIDIGAPRLEDFENVNVKDQFRVPLVGKKKNGDSVSRERKPLDPPTTNDPLIQEGYNYYLGHFYMFTRLQKHWMSLDAYCRACMVLGCNQILNAVTYTGLAYFTLFDYQWGTISFVIIPVVFACIHVHINFLLTKREAVIFLFVHSLAPLLAATAAGIQMVFTNDGKGDLGARIAQGIALGSYLCHFLSSGFLLFIGLQLQNGLPTRFTAVNYIDVLGLQKQAPEEPGLKRSFSTKIGEALFSGVASHESAEKAQPPIDQVVPQADSVRKADRMYQSLVERKVGLKSTMLGRSGSAPNLASVKEDVVVGESAEKAFATHLPAPRGSVRILNNLFETAPKFQRMGSSTVLGPRDYQPTAAQLHAPDVLAKMPQIAFRTVGTTMLLLWFAGIVFGSIAVSGVVDIGWDNVVSASAGKNVTVTAVGLLTRRLFESVDFKAPGRFLAIDLVLCSISDDALIKDTLSDRSYILSDEGVRKCQQGLCGEEKFTLKSEALKHRTVEIAERSYVVTPNNGRKIEITVPIKFTRDGTPQFFQVDNERVLGVYRGNLLSWGAHDGKFSGQIGGSCGFTDTENPPVGVCRNGRGYRIIFQQGDSCNV